MPRFVQRALLSLAAIAVTLVLVELVLRFAARSEVERLLTTRRHGATRDASAILCIGDSFTFGLYYRAEESYPGRLEQLLRAAEPAEEGAAARWLVVNGGIPGQNSAQVAARLPEQLAQLRPRAVVVLCGANDRWNSAQPQERRGIAGLVDDLALVKLTHLWLAGRREQLDAAARFRTYTMSEVAVEGATGIATIDYELNRTPLRGELHAEAVARRLEEIVATIRGAGALPILCDYPAPEPLYAPASRAAADVARRLDVAFVDLRAAFGRELELHRYDELFIPGDRHPTDRGLWRMAVLVARELVARGVVAPPPELRDALQAAPERDFTLPGFPEQLWPVTLEPSAECCSSFDLRGPPRARWRLVLSGADAPAQQFGLLELALADDATFRRSAADARLRGTFDDDGRATLRLPPELAADARFAALAVLHDMLFASPALSVRGIAGPHALR